MKKIVVAVFFLFLFLTVGGYYIITNEGKEENEQGLRIVEIPGKGTLITLPDGTMIHDQPTNRTVIKLPSGNWIVVLPEGRTMIKIPSEGRYIIEEEDGWINVSIENEDTLINKNSSPFFSSPQKNLLV